MANWLNIMSNEKDRRKAAISRFLQRIKFSDGCWEWVGTRQSSIGYGHLMIDYKKIYAHRFAYEIFVGPIPNDMAVCHHCDNPPCVNPRHLFIGSLKDNNVDMFDKGRGSNPPLHTGASHHKAKLTDMQVVQLRQIYRNGGMTQRQLAKNYGVSQGCVQTLVTEKWRRFDNVTGS